MPDIRFAGGVSYMMLLACSFWGKEKRCFQIFLLKHKWKQRCVSGVAVLRGDNEVLFLVQMPLKVMLVNTGSGTAC